MVAEQPFYPSDQDLVKTYTDIESSAREAINKGLVTDNPILIGQMADTRYSMATEGSINGSPASVFLQSAMDKLQQAEPSIKFADNHSLHLTIQEVLYTPEGIRKSIGPTNSPLADLRQSLQAYHQALLQNLAANYDPIRLTLRRIIPTLDIPLPNSDFRSASIVASFLTGEDQSIYEIRADIRDAVKKAGLPFSARIGSIKVIFITLGRTTHSPTRIGDRVPLLETIDVINNQIPENCTAAIKNIDLFSTTSVSYPYPYGHLYAWPPIALNRVDQLDDEFCVIRPSQRRLRASQ